MPTPCRRRPPRMRTGCNAGLTERFAAVNRPNPRVPKAPGRRRRSTQGRVSNPNGVAPAVWRLAIWGIPAPPHPCDASAQVPARTPCRARGPRTCRPLGRGTHTRRSSTLRHPVPAACRPCRWMAFPTAAVRPFPAPAGDIEGRKPFEPGTFGAPRCRSLLAMPGLRDASERLAPAVQASPRPSADHGRRVTVGPVRPVSPTRPSHCAAKHQLERDHPDRPPIPSD